MYAIWSFEVLNPQWSCVEITIKPFYPERRPALILVLRLIMRWRLHKHLKSFLNSSHVCNNPNRTHKQTDLSVNSINVCVSWVLLWVTLHHQFIRVDKFGTSAFSWKLVAFCMTVAPPLSVRLKYQEFISRLVGILLKST